MNPKPQSARVLVTGGTSQVGVFALPALVAAGESVVSLSRRIVPGTVAKALQPGKPVTWLHPGSTKSLTGGGGCHAPLATVRHPGQDCISCHMPRDASADIGHTMVTDHRIVRTKPLAPTPPTRVGRLIEFGDGPARARELGLAYGEVALRGNEFAAREAVRLLEQALSADPKDADVLTRLGYLYQTQGDLERAERLYSRAYEQDPTRAVVAANLGVFYANRGMLNRAVELWRRAFDQNPHLSEAGLNLANGLCAAGDPGAAEQAVRQVLRHNPDLGAARALLGAVTTGHCSGK